MNTMTYGRTAPPSDDDGGLARKLAAQWRTNGRKFAPFAAIVLGHVVLFYVISSGMLRNVTKVMLPQVVNITFVASPEPLKQTPPPPPPKTVPVAQKTPTFVPPLPQLNIVQTEPTITLPPPQPRAAEATPSTAAPSPAAPPAPQAPSVPKTVSGVEYIRAPQPVYPSIARRMGESGVVTLRVLIGAKGLAEQVLIHQSSGSANLDEAGRQAALRALYKPYLEDGKPVPVYALVPINFQLG